jgi:hypothetical protein
MQAIADVAERRFAWLVTQRGCTFVQEGELETVIDVRGPRPDFYVRSAAGPFLAEVKAFEKTGPLDRQGVFSIGMDRLLRPVSGAIDEARRQLRAYRSLGIPCVVVLDNWRQVGVDLDDVVLVQIFGELSFVVPVSAAGGPRGATRLEYGGGRTLGDTAGTYVSAVVVTVPLERDARDDFSRERSMRARVVHNPYATVPLPRSIFAGPDDEQLEHVDGAWRKIKRSSA